MPAAVCKRESATYDLSKSFGDSAYSLGDNRQSVLQIKTKSGGVYYITDEEGIVDNQRGFRIIDVKKNYSSPLSKDIRNAKIQMGEPFIYMTNGTFTQGILPSLLRASYQMKTDNVIEITCCTAQWAQHLKISQVSRKEVH